MQQKKDTAKIEITQKLKKLQTIKKEFGGPKGPEPTRYGDWECKDRVSDF